ncbi:MAG: DUF58 domain-containing protein [Phycisphaerales bacterium]
MSTTDRQHSANIRQWNTHHTPSAFKSPHSSFPPFKASRRSSKLTFSGFIYITLTLFLAVGAINSQNNLLFWLFGVAIAAILVSGIFSGSVLMRIELVAYPLADTHAGEPVCLRYAIVNHSRFYPLIAAMVSEVRDQHSPNEHYEPAALAHLGSKSRAMCAGTLTPKNRGKYTLNRICVSTRFPFGLMQKSLYFDCPRSLVVLPYRLQIKPNLIHIAHGQGEAVHKRTNASNATGDYWGLREYSPGDPKRSIAWKRSAHLGKLLVIEHAQPIATKVWIWLVHDHLADHSDPNRNNTVLFERQIALAASIAIDSNARNMPIGIWAPAQHLCIQPGLGAAHLSSCLHRLALLDASDSTHPDSPPTAAHADSIVTITRSSSDANLHSTNCQSLLLDVQDLSSALLDPDQLPSSLNITQSGVRR